MLSETASFQNTFPKSIQFQGDKNAAGYCSISQNYSSFHSVKYKISYTNIPTPLTSITPLGITWLNWGRKQGSAFPRWTELKVNSPWWFILSNTQPLFALCEGSDNATARALCDKPWHWYGRWLTSASQNATTYGCGCIMCIECGYCRTHNVKQR